MAEMGRWNGHIFTVSPTLIRGFTGLQIKASSSTEDKTSGKEKYVARKTGNPSEVSFAIGLNRFAGCDVRNEALGMVSDAQAGKTDYFYVGNKKLLAYKLMLTEATVRNVEIAADGTWTRAEVQVTMKQCSKADAATGTGSGSSSAKKSSSSKKSSKKTSTKKSSTTSSKKSSASTSAKKTASAVKQAASAVKKVLDNAKKASSAKKATTAKKTPTKKTTTTAKRGSANRK